MSADICKFEEFAGSSRGLMARPIMPNDVVALREHIETISYAVYNITLSTGPVTGSLNPATVMSTALVPWTRDKVGRSFLWDAPGTLWSEAGSVYRILITFTQTTAAGGKQFLEVWEVTAKSPTG